MSENKTINLTSQPKIGTEVFLLDGHKTTLIFVGYEYAISRCCHDDEFVWKLTKEKS